MKQGEMIDPKLKDFAVTERQKKLIDQINQHGGQRAASRAMGVPQGNISRTISAIKRRAAKAGYSPEHDMTHLVPDGYHVKGASTLYDAEGKPRLQWVKSSADADKQREALELAAQELSDGIKPFKRVKAPPRVLRDLCTVYTITDYHVGAYSWGNETGADWDMDIAEKTLLKGMSEMMDGSPDSEQAIFCQMGDFLHWDGLIAVTPTAKNILDADTRYPLLVQVAIRMCLRGVEMLLHKHKHVHVIMCEGNHDLTGSVWLQAIMRVAFKDNPRVTVDDSVFPYYSFVWGNTFLGWHHGHLSKINRMASKFFSEPKFRKQLAAAEYIYLSTGHYHTKEVREESGAVIERHPTLNARDAHGARGFDHSQRGAIAITYSKDRGETTRVTVVP